MLYNSLSHHISHSNEPLPYNYKCSYCCMPMFCMPFRQSLDVANDCDKITLFHHLRRITTDQRSVLEPVAYPLNSRCSHFHQHHTRTTEGAGLLGDWCRQPRRAKLLGVCCRFAAGLDCWLSACCMISCKDPSFCRLNCRLWNLTATIYAHHAWCLHARHLFPCHGV